MMRKRLKRHLKSLERYKISRATGEVGIGYRNDIWKSYHHQIEKFYDFIKINNDLRDLEL